MNHLRALLLLLLFLNTGVSQQMLAAGELEDVVRPLPTDVQKIIIRHYIQSYTTHEEQIKAVLALARKQTSKKWAETVLDVFSGLFQQKNEETVTHPRLVLSAALSKSFAMYLLMKRYLCEATHPNNAPNSSFDVSPAFVAAARYGSVKGLQYLGTRGNTEVADYQDNLALFMYAAEKGNTATLQFFLTLDPTLIEAVDDNGRTALLVATENDNPEAVEALLKEGASTEVVDSLSRWNPLHAAIYHLKVNLVALLLNYGAQPNAMRDGRQTALQAAIVPDALIETFLAQRGIRAADQLWPTERKKLRQLALEIMELLLADKRIDINQKNFQEEYALDLALHYPELNSSITRLLTEKGAQKTVPNPIPPF